MKDDGITRVACLVTSAYSSYSGCRQYRENLADAVAEVGEGAPRLDRLRHYFNHPGFVEPKVDATLAALADLGDAVRHDAHLLFVTHSIPTAMNDASGPEGNAYVAQHLAVVDEITERVRQETGHRYANELVYCSRSGPPHVPWLEPDVNDRIEELAADGVRAVVVVPIGFVSDHMEVIYDLDTEAQGDRGEGRCRVRPRRHRRRRPALRRDGPRPAGRAGRRRARRGRCAARRWVRWSRRGTSARPAAAPTPAARVRPSAAGTEAACPTTTTRPPCSRSRATSPWRPAPWCAAAGAATSRWPTPSPAPSTSSPRPTGPASG